MSNRDKNYLELCNDVLSELYFEEAQTFDELEDTEEGRRAKKELNRALTFICNNEDVAWTFRETTVSLMPTKDIKYYDKPNGFIQYIRYPKSNLLLNYVDESKFYPVNAKGMPVCYWFKGEKLALYPTPDKNYNEDMLYIRYLTYNYAVDCCGIGKPVMEYETDVPIIPNNHRDILVWKVCMDWRANLGDAKTQYYRSQYKTAYRALLNDCRETEEMGNGLHVGNFSPSYTQQMMGIFNNPFIVRRPGKGE